MKNYFNWFILISALVIGGLMLLMAVLAGLSGDGYGFFGNGIWVVVMAAAVAYEIKQIRK